MKRFKCPYCDAEVFLAYKDGKEIVCEVIREPEVYIASHTCRINKKWDYFKEKN